MSKEVFKNKVRDLLVKKIQAKKDDMEVRANVDNSDREAYSDWFNSDEAKKFFSTKVKKRIRLRESHDEEDGPVHEHDCSHCIFVGHDSPKGANEMMNANVIDMYVHEHPVKRSEHSLIRRFGDRPEQNSSTKMKWAMEDREEKWTNVVGAYHKKLKEGR
jgi:hypothetical protein